MNVVTMCVLGTDSAIATVTATGLKHIIWKLAIIVGNKKTANSSVMDNLYWQKPQQSCYWKFFILMREPQFRLYLCFGLCVVGYKYPTGQATAPLPSTAFLHRLWRSSRMFLVKSKRDLRRLSKYEISNKSQWHVCMFCCSNTPAGVKKQAEGGGGGVYQLVDVKGGGYLVPIIKVPQRS